MFKRIATGLMAILMLLSYVYTPSLGYAYFDRRVMEHNASLQIGDWRRPLSEIFYDFKNHALGEFLNTGNWSSTSSGFQSNFGLLFIENPYPSYEITLVAQLGVNEPSDATSGGFGLLFETSVNEALEDTGYILQFDRGLNGIVIRERINGSETSPILTMRHEDHPSIPQSRRDAFWTEEKTVILRVTPLDVAKGYRLLNVFIDGELIIENFLFESNLDPNDAYTGLRAWHRRTNFRSLRITPFEQNPSDFLSDIAWQATVRYRPHDIFYYDGALWLVRHAGHQNQPPSPNNLAPFGPYQELTHLYRPHNTYLTGDIVEHLGHRYQALNSGMGGQEPGTVTGWQKLVDYWVFYNIYQANDIVEHEGQFYQAQWFTTGHEPGTHAVWQLLDALEIP